MKPTTDIDVIIVNYNSGTVLAECFKTLLDEPSNGIHVWVIDNHSTDGSLETIPADANVTVIKNNRNVGFAQACNQAAKLGSAPMLAIINPDCFVRAAQLQQLAQDCQADESVALVGCRVLNQDGSMQSASRRRLPTFWRVVFQVTGLSRLKIFPGINIADPGQFEQPVLVEAVNGACFVVQRTAFEAINGFDEGYPLHFEDLDLFARLKQQGFTLLYQSAVAVVHLKGQANQDAKQIRTWKKIGLKRFFQKHRPKWEAYLVNIILVLR